MNIPPTSAVYSVPFWATEMSGSSCRVLVRRLGRVSYAKALALQKSLANSYKAISPSGPVSQIQKLFIIVIFPCTCVDPYIIIVW